MITHAILGLVLFGNLAAAVTVPFIAWLPVSDHDGQPIV